MAIESLRSSGRRWPFQTLSIKVSKRALLERKIITRRTKVAVSRDQEGKCLSINSYIFPQFTWRNKKILPPFSSILFYYYITQSLWYIIQFHAYLQFRSNRMRLIENRFQSESVTHVLLNALIPKFSLALIDRAIRRKAMVEKGIIKRGVIEGIRRSGSEIEARRQCCSRCSRGCHTSRRIVTGMRNSIFVRETIYTVGVSRDP